VNRATPPQSTTQSITPPKSQNTKQNKQTKITKQNKFLNVASIFSYATPPRPNALKNCRVEATFRFVGNPGQSSSSAYWSSKARRRRLRAPPLMPYCDAEVRLSESCSIWLTTRSAISAHEAQTFIAMLSGWKDFPQPKPKPGMSKSPQMRNAELRI